MLTIHGVGIEFRNVFDKNISPPVLNGFGGLIDLIEVLK